MTLLIYAVAVQKKVFLFEDQMSRCVIFVQKSRRRFTDIASQDGLSTENYLNHMWAAL